jgi:hypothetical protein
MKKVFITLLLVLGLAAAVSPAPAGAALRHTVGSQTWITNKPSGYYIGTAFPGWTFDNEPQFTSSAGWHFGRTYGYVNTCGWIEPNTLPGSYTSVADSCSATTESSLEHRLSIGNNFNCAAHACTDGSYVPLVPGCNTAEAYNWRGGALDSAGTATAGYVLYRFTTTDGSAAVVRDPNNGWLFIPAGCIDYNYLRAHGGLWNDND